MAHNPPPLDAARAWTDAMALLKGQREILLTIAGFFILLPALLLDTLRPFAATGTGTALFGELMRWFEANLPWVVLVALLAALGRLAILILLLGPGRPTVGEALKAGASLLPMFIVLDILVGFMLMGGLFLFVLPGIYLIGRTFLAETAFVATRAGGPVKGLAAGIEASRGNGWRIALAAVLIYLGGLIVGAAVGSVVGVIGALAGGGSAAAVLNALVDTGFGATVALLLELMGVAIWRQVAANVDK